MKKKLLYASPFPPMKSGISDYSEVLIYGLNKYFDITLLIDNYELSNNNLCTDFEVLKFKSNMDLSKFDYKIYNIGNNPDFHSYIYDISLKNPGLVILHDIVLYYLVIGYYNHYFNHLKSSFYSKIYQMEGAFGINLIKKYIKNKINLLTIKELSYKLSLNKELLLSNNKFMVHSKYSYDKIISIVNNPKRLKKINLVEQIVSFDSISKESFFKKFNLPDDAFIFCSLGYISHTKLNHIVCQQIIKLREKYKNIFYIMVGEGEYCDNYLCEYIIKTGFVDINIFNNFLFHSDVIINLRYPSMGETSAVTIRSLGLGKITIVSDDAWFSELPDDIVIKIKNDEISNSLLEKMEYLIKNINSLKELSQKAVEYIKKEHGLEKISREINNFLVEDY